MNPNLHDMDKPSDSIVKPNQFQAETICKFDSSELTFPYYDMYSVTYNNINSQYTSSSSSSSPSPSLNQPEQQLQSLTSPPPNETSFNESDLINGNSDYIGESNFPLNPIEPISIGPTINSYQVYNQQFIQQQNHHQPHHHHQQMSLPTPNDYRETGSNELTYNTNGNHVNYNNSVNLETLWSLNTEKCSSSSPSVNEHRSRSYSFSHYESSSNLNKHHNHHQHYPYLCPYSSMVTPPTESTIVSTQPIGSYTQINTNVYSTPPTLTSNSTNNCNFIHPFANLSSNSSCSTSISSLTSSTSSTNDQDYLFTIDDGDLSSCSSSASSNYSSSSSSNPSTRGYRKRITDYHRSSRGHRSKLTKKEKLDKMMSEDKRLESENSILKEQIRVMEHQFKILQTKITNILIDAAKKEG